MSQKVRGQHRPCSKVKDNTSVGVLGVAYMLQARSRSNIYVGDLGVACTLQQGQGYWLLHTPCSKVKDCCIHPAARSRSVAYMLHQGQGYCIHPAARSRIVAYTLQQGQGATPQWGSWGLHRSCGLWGLGSNVSPNLFFTTFIYIIGGFTDFYDIMDEWHVCICTSHYVTNNSSDKWNSSLTFSQKQCTFSGVSVLFRICTCNTLSIALSCCLSPFLKFSFRQWSEVK